MLGWAPEPFSEAMLHSKGEKDGKDRTLKGWAPLTSRVPATWEPGRGWEAVSSSPQIWAAASHLLWGFCSQVPWGS